MWRLWHNDSKSISGNVMSEADETPLRGYLVIYVDGYKLCYRNTVHLFREDGVTYQVPDRLMPPLIHEIGCMDWWIDGWAVGDNARNRLCNRNGNKPLKQFKSYDAAVSFIYRRQQKHKLHQHVLVYVTQVWNGKEKRDIIRSFDDIRAVDELRVKEWDEMRAREAEHAARYPDLEALSKRFGYLKALRLADLLRCVRAGTPAETMAPITKATRYRMLRELREVGFLD